MEIIGKVISEQTREQGSGLSRGQVGGIPGGENGRYQGLRDSRKPPRQSGVNKGEKSKQCGQKGNGDEQAGLLPRVERGVMSRGVTTLTHAVKGPLGSPC